MVCSCGLWLEVVAVVVNEWWVSTWMVVVVMTGVVMALMVTNYNGDT